MNNTEIKVLLAAPSYDGRFDVRFLDSLISTIQLCNQYNIKILPYFLCYDSLIQRARNDYFLTAYNSEVDVLFFIDSDIGWNPNDFVKLVLSEKDMIGGTYRKKTDEEELYAFKALEKDENFDLNIMNDGLLEVQGLGCGFLKLSKRCIKLLFESEKKYYNSEKGIVKNICDCIVNKNNNFVSEDITMGFKWTDLGGKLYLDTTIKLTHVGNKAYTGDVAEWLNNWKIKLQSNKNNARSSEELSKYFDQDLQNQNNEEDDTFKVL
jgi:hypothetical protein